MNYAQIENTFDKVEIALGKLLTLCGKYPTLNLQINIQQFMIDILSIKDNFLDVSTKFDIRNVKRLKEQYQNLQTKVVQIEKKVLKTGHTLACQSYDIYNKIDELKIILTEDERKYAYKEESLEYLNILSAYFLLCGQYINEAFGIQSIILK